MTVAECWTSSSTRACPSGLGVCLVTCSHCPLGLPRRILFGSLQRACLTCLGKELHAGKWQKLSGLERIRKQSFSAIKVSYLVLFKAWCDGMGYITYLWCNAIQVCVKYSIGCLTYYMWCVICVLKCEKLYLMITASCKRYTPTVISQLLYNHSNYYSAAAVFNRMTAVT